MFAIRCDDENILFADRCTIEYSYASVLYILMLVYFDYFIY